LRLWTNTALRLLFGVYFVLTSLYCLLAFLPYTFYFLIKAPAYSWMPWFVHHQAVLYWIAIASAVFASRNVRHASRIKDLRLLLFAAGLAPAGIYLTFRPFLVTLESNRLAYWWSLAALVPLAAASSLRSSDRPKLSAQKAISSTGELLSYSGALLAAFILSTVYFVSAKIQVHSQEHAFHLRAADVVSASWSLLSHIVLAIVVFSVINLVSVIAARSNRPHTVKLVINGTLIVAALWAVLFHFLESALSFAGWLAHLYSALLALTLTLWGFSLVLPFLEQRAATQTLSRHNLHLGTWSALLAACGLALAFPSIVGDADWSGFLQSGVTLLLWVVVSVCVFRLWRKRVHYSAAKRLTVVAVSVLLYKGLQATEIFWSRALGSTDDEIALSLQEYGGHDNSFLLAHEILGNSRHEVCGDLCRILRENTNIRDTRARADIQLVDSLAPATGNRPNIFVFVIDSMRPDYLGAYNPRVDYTPNLDAFARDSVVLHNVYSQYAGTSLSEPTIWSGALLLHSHYLQPFSRLNSLDRMLHTDGYRMLVSVDEVLSAIMPADDNIVRLDSDKKLWNSFELGSTLRQAEAVLDSQNSQQPVFLYAQPKNVHQFAHNDVPSPTSQHWPQRPGLNTRITYEVHWVDSCLGQFFDYLKQRGMYDNSIIIVTSDHGDATGEFGRMSHSNAIWPEVMRVPLIIHLPKSLRQREVYDDTRLATLTDVTPTLFYLLGHRPIRKNPLYGRPLLAETRQELNDYPPKDVLMASDVHAVYGILTADGRYLYTTYDSPARSYLFDLATDPNAQHDILSAALKQRYDEEIIEHLQSIGDYYGYKPGVGSLLASAGN